MLLQGFFLDSWLSAFPRMNTASIREDLTAFPHIGFPDMKLSRISSDADFSGFPQ